METHPFVMSQFELEVVMQKDYLCTYVCVWYNNYIATYLHILLSCSILSTANMT